MFAGRKRMPKVIASPEMASDGANIVSTSFKPWPPGSDGLGRLADADAGAVCQTDQALSEQTPTIIHSKVGSLECR
jgi:hypothetical protein